MGTTISIPMLSFLLQEAVAAILAGLLECGTGNSRSGQAVPACFPLHRAGQFRPSFSENRPCQDGLLRAAKCSHWMAQTEAPALGSYCTSNNADVTF